MSNNITMRDDLPVCAECAALRHDIARHVEICASQAQEIEELRADLAAARAALAAVSERIDRGYYHTAKALIDAALAGEARHDK